MTKAGTSKASAAERRQEFIEAYCGPCKGNGTRAAIVAGFSPKTARQQAARLLTDVAVKRAIAKRRAKALAHASKVTDMTAETVLADLAEAMQFDPGDMYDPVTKEFLPVPDMPAHIRRHLEGHKVEVREVKDGKGATVVTDVKHAKKSVTRDQAMKHFGLYEKDNIQRELPPIRIRFV